MVKLLDHIMGNLAALEAGADVDINNVAMRLALDLTGALHPLLQRAGGRYQRMTGGVWHCAAQALWASGRTLARRPASPTRAPMSSSRS